MYVEIGRLTNWVNDLQSGMSINCVYCGHNYGPDDEVPATMADVLKEHIAQCPKHPMSALKADNRALGEKLAECIDKLDMRITDESFVESLRALGADGAGEEKPDDIMDCGLKRSECSNPKMHAPMKPDDAGGGEVENG